MLKKLILFLFLLTSISIAQSKDDFDLEANSLRKTTHDHLMYDYLTVTNDMLEGTLLKDGYFTLGTGSMGTSRSHFDDNCQIAYGHPFAKTSYPVVLIDGEEYLYSDLFDELNSIISKSSRRTLTAYNENDQIIVSFQVTVSDTSNQLILEQKITNKSEESLSIGSKIIFDPALGKNGDGVIPLSGGFLQEESNIKYENIIDPLIVFEKSSGNKGMVINFEFDTKQPSSITARNWLSENHADLKITKLFDLLLEFNWDEVELEQNESLTSKIIINVLPPQFGDVFARWDFPSFIDINNGQMFPSTFDSYLGLYKSNYELNDLTFELELPSSLNNNSSNTVTFSNEENQFVKIPVNTRIIYENRIDEIGINILKDGQKLEAIKRNIFIPATPVSDEGLEVVIDSINTSLFPNIDLLFHVKNEENGYFLTDLIEDNVFFYENDNRITDYTFMRDTSGGINAVDVVFVLDVTGSMGNEIAEVKNNIIEFSDMLSQKGIDYKFGMVTFLDIIENTYNFTRDVQLFHSYISDQHAHGGGDGPENSLDALNAAAAFDYRENASRIIIWITDADYHQNDGVTSRISTDVANTLLTKGIQVHNVGTEYFKSSYYDPIILPTGGNYYDINGNFRDILLDISNLKQSYKFVISYTSYSSSTENSLKVKIHYAGLGGEASINTSNGLNKIEQKTLSFYPNPFNPEVNFNISHQNYSDGELNIYNILGQCVSKIAFTKANANNLKWNAQNNMDVQVGTGFYIARLTLKNQGNIVHQESAKILYLK